MQEDAGHEEEGWRERSELACYGLEVENVCLGVDDYGTVLSYEFNDDCYYLSAHVLFPSSFFLIIIISNKYNNNMYYNKYNNSIISIIIV